MAIYQKCPYCGKVQMDIQGEHIYTNDEGDLLDLDGSIIDGYPLDENWLPVQCEYCHKVARGYEFDWVTRKEWGYWNRFYAWWIWKWDAFVDWCRWFARLFRF